MENTMMMPEFIEVGTTKYISEDAVEKALANLRETTIKQMAAVTLSNLLDDLEDFLNQQRRSLNFDISEEKKVEEQPEAPTHSNKRGKVAINDDETQKMIVDEYFNNDISRKEICEKYNISQSTLERYVKRFADGRAKWKTSAGPRAVYGGDARPITVDEYNEIKSLYEKGGVTQRELAEMFSLSTWRISNICRGLSTLMVDEFYKNPAPINEEDFKKWNQHICELARTSAAINNTSATDILRDAYEIMNSTYGIVWSQEKKDFVEDQGRSPFSTRELVYWIEKKNPASKNLLSSIIVNMGTNKEGK